MISMLSALVLIQTNAKEINIAPLSFELEVTDTKSEVPSIKGKPVSGSLLESDGTELPSYYSSKDLGYTTAIKDQQKTNCCWAYSTISNLELVMKKNGEQPDTYSPLHMAYTQSDILSPYGWFFRNRWLNIGGLPDMSIGYLVYGNGTREEYLENSDLADLSVITTTTEPQYKELEAVHDLESTPLISVDKIINIDTSDRDNVKRAIKEYGCVSTSFSVTWSAFDTSRTNYYYNNAVSNNGHAVIIIGWDDDYDKENFTGSCKPENNGAWICQNSWGEKAGENGFFYISYEDKTLFIESLGQTFSITGYHHVGRYEKNHSPGQSSYSGYWEPFDNNQTNTATYINRFSFEEDELVQRIEFDCPCVGSDYSVYYIPTSGSTPSTSDSWTELSSGTVEYSGTICALCDNIEIPSGTGFIGVKLTKNNGSDLRMGVLNDWSYFKIPDYDSDMAFITKDGLSILKARDYTTKNTVFSMCVKTTKNYLYGDSDNNKKISIKDATIIQRKLADLPAPVYFEITADSDNSGMVDITDVTVIQKHLAHKETDYVGKHIS